MINLSLSFPNKWAKTKSSRGSRKYLFNRFPHTQALSYLLSATSTIQKFSRNLACSPVQGCGLKSGNQIWARLISVGADLKLYYRRLSKSLNLNLCTKTNKRLKKEKTVLGELSSTRCPETIQWICFNVKIWRRLKFRAIRAYRWHGAFRSSPNE